MSDRTPPSPLLSARMTNSTYLTVTTSNRAQSAMETTPRIEASVTRSLAAWTMAAWKA